MRAAAAWPREFILLGLLCEQPTYGYDLYGRVAGDATLAALWRVERSQLYFLLHKLADRGLITEGAAAQGGGPPRALYAPTEAGRAALAEWLRTPDIPPQQLRTAFLVKLYLGLRLAPPTARQLLADQRRVLAEWAARQAARADGPTFAAAVSRLRLAQCAAALNWLDELEQRLAQGPPLLTDLLPPGLSPSEGV